MYKPYCCVLDRSSSDQNNNDVSRKKQNKNKKHYPEPLNERDENGVSTLGWSGKVRRTKGTVSMQKWVSGARDDGKLARIHLLPWFQGVRINNERHRHLPGHLINSEWLILLKHMWLCF